LVFLVSFAVVLTVYYGVLNPGNRGSDEPAAAVPPLSRPAPVMLAPPPAPAPIVVPESRPDPVIAPLAVPEPVSTALIEGPEPAANPSPEPPDIPAQPAPTVLPAPPTVIPGIPSAGSHIIAEGDSLWSIAEGWFNDGAMWLEIVKANPDLDPDRLTVGRRIVLPLPTPRSRPVLAEIRPGGTSPYVVRSGDTLTEIAARFYSSSSYWELIYQANRFVIGGDSDALELGMKLVLPPIPASDQP